jgi:hypothetical protein
MRLHILAAAVGLTFALAGCVTSGGLHTNGASIDPSTLKADRSFANVQVSDAAWPKEDWWTGLGDPQLNTLIAEACTTVPRSLSPTRVRALHKPKPVPPMPHAIRR